MKMLLKTLLTVTVALWINFAGAQQQLEVIELQSKSVEQVLPVLQPLLEPGGTLSGMNNQLFLRASARNRAEIKKALAAIDTPTRRLIIRTSQNREAENNAQGAQASGQVVLGSSRNTHVQAQVWNTKSVRGESAGQMVQTVEGGQAFIQIGRSLAIPMRQVVVGPGGAIINETVVYRDVGSGFYAVPHLNGQRVTIEISQQADSVASYRSGNINTQRLSTTVSGRLGEWIELGGAGRQSDRQQSGTLSLSTSDIRDQRSIWLKVEEVE
jgi:type II secretory pathway component GspD/PulD (secretin)